MDMSPSGMIACPATSTMFVYLATFLWFVIPAVWRSRSLAAALVPLALNVADAWLGIIRTMRGMAISGSHSNASLAAGLAEAEARVLFGLVTSAILLAIFTIVAYRRRHQSRERGVVIALAILIAIASIATMFVRVRASLYYPAMTTAYILIAIAVLLAILAFRKGSEPRTLAIALIANIAISSVVWSVMKHLEHIAYFGS